MKGPTEKSYQEAKDLLPFRKSVYRVVSQIPVGRVMTYGAVAAKIGNPRASRAVGTALAENCYQDVPCHRVVRSDGTIGEYAFGGPKAKRHQLEAEGVLVDGSGRVVFPS